MERCGWAGPEQIYNLAHVDDIVAADDLADDKADSVGRQHGVFPNGMVGRFGRS